MFDIGFYILGEGRKSSAEQPSAKRDECFRARCWCFEVEKRTSLVIATTFLSKNRHSYTVLIMGTPKKVPLYFLETPISVHMIQKAGMQAPKPQ